MLPKCVLVVATLFATTLPGLAADTAKAKRDDSASEKLGMKLSLQCWTFNRLTFFETVDKAGGTGRQIPGDLSRPEAQTRLEGESQPQHERRDHRARSRRSWPTPAV